MSATAERIARGRDAWGRGRWAEALCRLSLVLSGWRIVATRLRTPLGEIDIVARRSDVVAIIEVKARPTLDEAREAVRYPQKKRLSRAAGWFLSGRPDLAGHTLRFDAMLVTPWRWPRRIEDAWRDERF